MTVERRPEEGEGYLTFRLFFLRKQALCIWNRPNRRPAASASSSSSTSCVCRFDDLSSVCLCLMPFACRRQCSHSLFLSPAPFFLSVKSNSLVASLIGLSEFVCLTDSEVCCFSAVAVRSQSWHATYRVSNRVGKAQLSCSVQQSLSLRWPLATVSAWWLSLLVKLFSLVCIHYTTLAPPHKAARQAFCSLRERERERERERRNRTCCLCCS